MKSPEVDAIITPSTTDSKSSIEHHMNIVFQNRFCIHGELGQMNAESDYEYLVHCPTNPMKVFASKELSERYLERWTQKDRNRMDKYCRESLNSLEVWILVLIRWRKGAMDRSEKILKEMLADDELKNRLQKIDSFLKDKVYKHFQITI